MCEVAKDVDDVDWRSFLDEWSNVDEVSGDDGPLVDWAFTGGLIEGANAILDVVARAGAGIT